MAEDFLCDLNELMTLVNAKHNDQQDCLQAFLSYVENHDLCISQFEERIKKYEIQINTLSADKDVLKQEVAGLEAKLKYAQRIIDKEKNHRERTEADCQNLEQQLQVIRDILQDNRNKLHDETRDKLQYLSTMDQRLSTINESFHNATGSGLSDLSYSRSEDDIDSEVTRLPRRLRRSRMYAEDDTCITSPKRRRSSINTARNDIRARSGDCLNATTRVNIGRGVPVATSIIETFPSTTSLIRPLEPAKPSAHHISTDSGDSEFTANQNKPKAMEFDDQHLQSPNGFLQFDLNALHSTAHSLVNKTVIRPEICDPCSKRIKFGRLALKCSDCRTVCHVHCKSKLRLPCIPPGCGIPTSKDTFGTIRDYAPPTEPMIPAIIVHCVNEIEARGLSEVGLYRVSGSDKEVKILKEKFLKGKGVPNLSLINDIHVVTGCLKDFLRSLEEPLVTFHLRRRFVDAIQRNYYSETRHADLYQTVTELPQPNRDTLAFLILHLKRVAVVRECKMPVRSLAKIMGPTVIGYSRIDTEQVYEETEQTFMVMEELLAIPEDYWTKFLVRYSPGIPCTPSTGSLREPCGFLDSPLISGQVTVRKKKI